ncbi:LOW QUALITY PROTEIN: aladin [Hyalella azteca]|uniref:LOW QUALITY PROTEIN: aladin n=1 Tax=Hyalella azteca TaxID=294128 RepID=A0A979FWK3_HYAAZ|nr:LOW QUALITY PROTEIN: aladin [Hyalella azteca]
MLDLHMLKSLPGNGEVTACEREGVLRCDSSDLAVKTAQLMLGCSEPILETESCETVRPALGKHDAQNAFSARPRLPASIVIAYRERGLAGCLEQLVEDSEPGWLMAIARVAAKAALAGLSTAEQVTKFTRFERSISTRTHTSGLGGGSREIVSISWHSCSRRLAVAFTDDSVKIYSQKPLQPLLKHRIQRRVTQVQWLPYSMSVACVSCEAGVLLWSVDPSSVVTRPSGACISLLPFLHNASHAVMTTHPQGTSVACSDGRGVRVWDTALLMSTEVQRSGHVTHLAFSPDATRLLVVMARPPTLRVFDTSDWSLQEWVSSSEVSCCAWSPCSDYVVFCTADPAVLYFLSPTTAATAFCTADPAVLYFLSPTTAATAATMLADLSLVQLADTSGQTVSVGGAVKGMAWGGERLLLYFHSCSYLVLFHTLTIHALKIAINGVIKGPDDCLPVSAAFHPSQPSLLTVAWDDGTLQHVPLLYTSRQTTSTSNIGALNTTLAEFNTTVADYHTTNVNSPWNDSHITPREFQSDTLNGSLWPNNSILS